jgi:hypothetical protein
MHQWATTGTTTGAMYTDWWSSPVYSTAWLLLIPIWREFHFYIGHRALHWKRIYPYVHYLHHKVSMRNRCERTPLLVILAATASCKPRRSGCSSVIDTEI